MAGLIGNIGQLFTAFMLWAKDIGDAVLGSPLLLIGFAIGVAGIAITFFKRLLHN